MEGVATRSDLLKDLISSCNNHLKVVEAKSRDKKSSAFSKESFRDSRLLHKHLGELMNKSKGSISELVQETIMEVIRNMNLQV